MAKQVKRFYEFGPFRLDVTERVLRRNGKEIGLWPKTYEVLLVLIENNGHIVEKEVLMEKCWPDSYVAEANITQNISVLRQKLGEEGDNHQYIKTIPKRGYRFTANVREVVEEVENLISISNKGKYILVLSATIDDIDKPIAEAIEAHLRKLSKDVTLTLVRVEDGSVILILEGTRVGFERISELIESGQLSKVLDFDIIELRWGVSSERVKVEPQNRDRSYSEDSSHREDTWFPTQLALALKPAFDNQSVFHNLFGADLEQAAMRYEKIRQKLIKFFGLRGAEFPEELADETINRVARKIEQVKEILDLDSYFYGVAGKVLLESLKGRPSSPALPILDLVNAENNKGKLECLEKCLLSLPDDERELLLMYYEPSANKKIISRKNLAAQLGISVNSLRIRAHRIREKLEWCVSVCIERASQDI